VRGLALDIFIATAIASDAELIRLKLFLNAQSSRQMLRFGSRLDLPPFAGDA
jgi:hypothetical protein